ncbi:hypothetical protein [Megavirus chiliensis]|uniref:Uncharacterized protein n=2 Tax=Megamimivirinae TaxID=3044648 RepID=A0A2L2DNY8_MIMIV|nr:hypothetical protein MegaChil _gp1027 [Megavirus chiliensis]AEQ33479.1 hypothetical protein [Megavirus chiliensis]AVG47864.1 hypothetical protein [Acanthamoeba polyphaga mimivirus]
MRRNSPQHFYNPGVHYTENPLTGYKLMMCSLSNGGNYKFTEEPFFALATVKITSLARVVTLNNSKIEGHVRTSEIYVEQIEKFDGTIIDDTYTCFHPAFPFDTSDYKIGSSIRPTRDLDINCNNIDKLTDHNGINLFLVNKEDLIEASKIIS